MKPFLKYAEQLDALLDEIEWGQRPYHRAEAVKKVLMHQPAEILHGAGNESSIWRAGAYFTSPHLADLALNPLTQRGRLLRNPVFDPTCGAGDLLLRWADELPVSRNLLSTLATWESLLRGNDLFHEFLTVAKRRLVLKAISRGARLQGGRPPKVDKLFPGIKRGDARDAHDQDTVLTLVMNPPFGKVSAPRECNWTSGKVSLAALLLESCIKQAQPKTQVVAILPDVLRTGTRYERWRKLISENLKIVRVQPYGRFDKYADIDVFIIEGTVGHGKQIKWWQASSKAQYGVIGDFFEVSVGAVVPHRDPNRGAWHPFATAKSVTPWSTIPELKLHRRFEGAVVAPPFVTVRRTSSPRDNARAVGSIVTGQDKVAVENHLLVLKPKSGRIDECESLLTNLRDARTKKWLDHRIRCRHLTVGVLRELPMWAKKHE
ncbi:MAG TPA: hypothetical protein VF773_12400 [Verrucomicrobiae bacterium]